MTGDGWPLEPDRQLQGVTESVVATLGPNDRWNLAALGLRAGEASARDGRVTARTWGRTRTRRNFERRGGGVVQFVRDPVVFVDAALGIAERAHPVDDSADAWVEVRVERLAEGDTGADGDSGETDAQQGTTWVDWALDPRSGTVERRGVRTINRGFNAVVEATVWASRLSVEAYDEAELRDRLAFLAEVVEASGTERDRMAFERIGSYVDWR